MFDIAWSEFLVVAVVALVVVGPRDLPALLRTVGKTVASLRRMAGEFQSQFHEAMREAELDDLKREVTGLKDVASKVTGASPFQIARDEIRSAIEGKPSALAGDPAKADVDAPSALAPQPEIAPSEEPPAPNAGDFAIARELAGKKAAATAGSAASAAKAVAESKGEASPKVDAKPKPSKPKTEAKPKPPGKSRSASQPKPAASQAGAGNGAAKAAKPKASKPKPGAPGAAA